MTFPQMARGGRQKLIRTTLAVAAAYVVAAKFGFTMAFSVEQVTLVWPPTALSLAAVLLIGQEIWPGIFLGAMYRRVPKVKFLGYNVLRASELGCDKLVVQPEVIPAPKGGTGGVSKP